MNASKIRELDPKEIEAQLAETGEHLFRLQFQMKMGQTDPLKKFRILRKDRARMLTILAEKQAKQAEKQS